MFLLKASNQVTGELQPCWTDAPTTSHAMMDLEELREIMSIGEDRGLNVILSFLKSSLWTYYMCIYCVCVSLQNFLCYSCKEYVEDLSKIPKKALEVSPDLWLWMNKRQHSSDLQWWNVNSWHLFKYRIVCFSILAFIPFCLLLLKLNKNLFVFLNLD